MTPIGANWLQKDQIFVASGVIVRVPLGRRNWSDFASTQEMIEQLRSPSLDLGADVRFAIHSRFLQPILDTTLLFLGLPFVVTRSNRNPFISLGLCLAVVTVFMLVNLGCKSTRHQRLAQPTLAAWLPLMIFAPLAVMLAGPLRE